MSIRKMIVLLSVAVSLLVAFHPPVDTAGPLTAKIEGPSKITQATNPEQFAVVLENSADARGPRYGAEPRYRRVARPARGSCTFCRCGQREQRTAQHLSITPGAGDPTTLSIRSMLLSNLSRRVCAQTAHPILP